MGFTIISDMCHMFCYYFRHVPHVLLLFQTCATCFAVISDVCHMFCYYFIGLPHVLLLFQRFATCFAIISEVRHMFCYYFRVSAACFAIISDVARCFSGPCIHNGTCISQVDHYTCECEAGYTGLHCETGHQYNRIE